MVTRTIRVDKVMWDSLPADSNKSAFIRDVIKNYIQGNMATGEEIHVLQNENRMLHGLVDNLQKDKEFLQRQVEIYLPKPKKWYQFWK